MAENRLFQMVYLLLERGKITAKELAEMRYNMKYEWKKHEKQLYSTKEEPSVIIIPPQNFIMISGEGNPNNDDFSQRVSALYSLAYPIKMRYKTLCSTNWNEPNQLEYHDYTVFPLEGIWTSSNPDNYLDKDSFIYTIMIRQPDFITRDIFEDIYEVVKNKKPNPLLREVVFNTFEDGQCVQLLHRGSFDDEPESFSQMDSYAKTNGFERKNHFHREIYLTDARKTLPEKRKTILRYQVK